MIALDQRLSLVHRLADDVFVLDFPYFESFMYLGQGSFGSRIYPKTSCETLNSTSQGFSHLDVKQTCPQGISCDIFDKCSLPEFAGIDMIHMPHVHCNISIIVKLGVINSQFYQFLRFCSSKDFFVSLMVSLNVLPKNKRYL
jgi:hypothetical protein